VFILVIVLFGLACGVVGKLVNRSSDRRQQRWNAQSGGDRRLIVPLPSVVDPVENPRNVDDGTDFGYREFD
jgi:hypothetical protein